LAAHPITALWRAGVNLSLNTDNRLMSCITLSGEAADLLAHTPLSLQDLARMQLCAAGASFMPESARKNAQDSIIAWARTQQTNLEA
jgi:adenosine deaminase